MKKSIFQNMSALSLWLLFFLLTACSTSSSSSASPVQKTSLVVYKNCEPASPITNSNAGPEAQGTSRNAEVWSLLESTSGIPPTAKSEVKIVWRMTGSGDFHVVALGSSNLSVAPSQGLVYMMVQVGITQVVNGVPFLLFPYKAVGISM